MDGEGFRALPRMLWHYTSFAGLQGILKSEAFWATDIRFLNDGSEYLHYFNLLHLATDARWAGMPLQVPLVSALTALRARTMKNGRPGSRTFGHAPFVCSFSTREDDLSQWRAYGRYGDAYAIGVELGALLAGAAAVKASLSPCEYVEGAEAPGEDKRYFSELLDDLAEHVTKTSNEPAELQIRALEWLESQGDRLTIAATRVKDAKFSDEQEWRLIATREASATDVNVRMAKHGLPTPYVSLEVLKHHQCSIQRILVGPTTHADLARNAILRLCQSLDRGWIEVDSSLVPYRET